MAKDNQDFYVSFGSNAKAWAGQLANDLAPARREIAEFSKALEGLGKGPSGAALAALLKGMRGGPAVPPPPKPSATGDGGGSGHAVGSEFAEMARNAKTYMAELDGMVAKLATVVQAVSVVGGKLSEPAKFVNRSRGNTSSLTQKSRQTTESVESGQLSSRGKPVRPGQFAPAGTGGAVSAESRTKPSARTAPTTGAANAVSITNTPKVLVDDAAFKRVVQAVEKNVKATKRVESAIDRLTTTLASRNTGGSRGEEGKRAKRDKAGKGEDRQPPVPAEVRAAQRREARSTQDGGSAEAVRAQRNADATERRAAIGMLQASRDALATRGGQDELVAAADAEIKKLAAEIETLEKPLQRERKAGNRAAAAEAREQAGPQLTGAQRKAAAENIQLAANPDELDHMVRTQRLGKKSSESLRDIATSFTQAGYPTPYTSKTSNRDLQALIAESRRAFDAAGDDVARFAAEKVRAVPTEVAKPVRGLISGIVKAMRRSTEEELASEDLRTDKTSGQAHLREAFNLPRPPEIVGAEGVVAARNARADAKADETAMRLLRRDPNFNPYDPSLRKGIVGNDQTARDAREALSRLTRAIERLDQAWAGGTQRPPEELHEGIKLRGTARRDFQTQAEAMQSDIRARAESSRDYREASYNALFGGVTGQANSGAGTSNMDITRLLPGVTRNRKFDLRPTQEAMDAGVEFAPLSKAYTKFTSAFRKASALGNDAGPEEMLQAENRWRIALSRVFDAYERVFNAKLPTFDRPLDTLGYGAHLGYGGQQSVREYSLSQQSHAVAEDRAQQAAQRRAAARALKTGAGDPEILDRAAKLTQTRLDRYGALKGTVGNYDLSNLTDRERLMARGKAAGVPLSLEQTNSAQQVNSAIDEAITRAVANLERLTANAATRAATKTTAKDKAADKGGSGGSGGGGGRSGGAGAGGGKGDRDVLERILGELTAIHDTVRAGTKLTIRRATPRKATAKPGDADDAGKRQTQDRAAVRQAAASSKRAAEEARAAKANENKQAATLRNQQQFFEALKRTDPELHARLQGKAPIEQAVELVRGGVSGRVRRSELPALFGTQLGATPTEARQNVGQALNQAQVNDRAAAMAEIAAEHTRAMAQAAQQGSIAQRNYAGTMQLVSAAARMQVRELERLATARRNGDTSAENEAATTQALIRAYATLNRELKAQEGFSNGTTRRGAIANVFGGAGAPVSSSQLSDIARKSKVDEAVNTAAAAAGSNTSGTRQVAENEGGNIGDAMGNAARSHFAALFGDKGFFGRLVNSTGTFLVRNFSAGIVFGLGNALQDAVSQAVQTESTFVRVSEALNATGRSSDGLRTKLQDLSQKYGVALKDVYTTTASLAGLFDASDVHNDQLVGLTEVATQLEIISGGALSATEAVKSLSSVTAAYGEESSKHIADVATVIQNQLGVNVEDTIEGVSRLSGMTKEMGISFADAATQVAAISKLTGQSGEAAGEQYSRMLESLQTGKTQNVVERALGGVGVDVSGALATRDYSTAINELLGSYNKLNSAEKERVTVNLGGARQAAATNAFLSQGAQILNVQTDAQNANGAAQERAQKISEQLNVQMQKLRQGFVNFFADIERSGALDAFGVALKTLTVTIDGVNDAISTMSDLIEKVPGGQAIEHLIMLVAGLSAGFVVARIAARGLLTALQVPGAIVRGAGAKAAGAAGAGAAEAGAAEAGVVGAGAAEAGGGVGMMALLRGTRRAATPAPFTPSSMNRYLPTMSSRNIAEDTRRLEAAREAAALGGEYRPPVLTSGMTPAQASAAAFTHTQNYGRVDENGMPIGRSRSVYARGSALAGSVQDRISGRGEAFAASARAAAQRADDLRLTRGLGPMMGEQQVSRVAPAVASAQARGYAALAGAANTAGSAVGRVESGMQRMARSALIANVAMLGIAAGVGVLIAGYQSFKQIHDEYKAAFTTAFGDPNANDDNGSDAKKARNAFQAVSDHNTDQNKGFTGVGRALFHGVRDVLTLRNPWGSATADEDSGVVPDTWNTSYAKLAQSTMGRLAALNKLNKTMGVTSAGVDSAISANQDDLSNYVKEIGNSSMSDAQKASLLSSVEDLQSKLQNSASGWKLIGDGLRRVDVMTSDQLAGIGGLVTSLSGLGTSVAQQFSDLSQMQTDQLGIDPASRAGAALGELANRGYYTNTYRGIRDSQTGKILTSGQTPNLAQYGAGHAANGARKDDNLGTAATGNVREQPYQQAYGKGTFHQYSQARLERDQEVVLRTALASVRATIATLQDGSDEKAKEIQLAGSLESQLSQTVGTRLQNVTDKAQAMLANAAFSGNYAAAGNAAKVIQALKAQGKESNTPKVVTQGLINQANDQAAQTAAQGASFEADQAKLHTRNQLALANDELRSANESLAVIQSRFNAGRASMASLTAAQGRQKSAADAAQDAELSLEEARLSLSQDRKIAPGDEVAVARGRIATDRKLMRDAAAKYTENSPEYLQAQQQMLDDQRNLQTTIDTAAQSAFNLAVAYDNAAGRTVQAAIDAWKGSKAAYSRALKKAGGNKNAASVRDARSDEVTKQAAVRDARLQDELDTINFNKDMNRISSATAIQELQHILDTEKLTKAERRNILLQIHGLQQDIVSQVTGAGFNIPGDITMPTPYQVRRSLGIDKVRTVVKQSMEDITNAATPKKAAGVTANNQNAALINAVQSVTAAVHAKGAQHVSVKQDNNFHVPTAHVAHQIAAQVISIINQQSGQQVRANASTPRKVSTR